MKQVLVLFHTVLFIVDLIKGQPNSFKRIHGPKFLSDRIAIVGAGPAGVHMAYRLKQEGFQNVVILEKSNRIGGKSLSIPHRGVAYEMGTSSAQIDYGAIFNLTMDVNGGNMRMYPGRQYWINQSTPLDLVTYLVRVTHKHPLALMAAMQDEVRRYSTKHYQLFGSYEGELMPRPSEDVMREVKGTLRDFLSRNNFPLLYIIFQYSFTAQGYGRLEDEAALYGLMWMTPKFTQSLINPVGPFVYAIDSGYQFLWEKVVTRSNVKVEFGVDIKRIRRGYRSGIMIDYQYKLSGARRRVLYDFLILTPDLPSMTKIVDFDFKERSLFLKLKDRNYFITTLVDSAPGVRSTSPMNFYSYNLLSRDDYKVWSSVDRYAAIYNITGEYYRRGLTRGGDNCVSCQSTVFYQYGTKDPTDIKTYRLINKHLKDHLVTYKQEDAVVINRQVWPFLFRFPACEMEKGIIWDVFDIQGTRNTWYTGASVSFESVKSVVEYNNLLLRQAKLFSK